MKSRKNTLSALLLSGLLVLGVASCTTTKYVAIEPECQAPATPVLPNVDRGSLWDALGDEEYRKVETYIDRLWAYSDQQAAIISTLCEDE